MSNAQGESVKRHFEGGKLTRLELTMLPRDPQRSLGNLRTVLCASFNYVRKYPKKLALFIDVVKFMANYGMMYQKTMEEKIVEKEVEQKEEVNNVE